MDIIGVSGRVASSGNQKMYKKEAGKQGSFVEEDAKTNSESLKSKKTTKKAKKK